MKVGQNWWEKGVNFQRESSIIVEKRYKKKILELLEQFDAEVYVREVVLIRKDLKALGVE